MREGERGGGRAGGRERVDERGRKRKEGSGKGDLGSEEGRALVQLVSVPDPFYCVK